MKVSDATLMAFHDGELDPETARRIRLARLTDLELNTRLEALEQLGDFVRVWSAARASVLAPERPLRRAPRGRALRATGFAVALAAAALVTSALLRDAAPAHVVARAAPSAARSPAPARLEPAVAVESVDFGAQPGTIFLVESAKSDTTVVWLAEGPAPSATGTL